MNYENLDLCKRYEEFRDNDFDGRMMCCACGGGTSGKGKYISETKFWKRYKRLHYFFHVLIFLSTFISQNRHGFLEKTEKRVILFAPKQGAFATKMSKARLQLEIF